MLLTLLAIYFGLSSSLMFSLGRSAINKKDYSFALFVACCWVVLLMTCVMAANDIADFVKD